MNSFRSSSLRLVLASLTLGGLLAAPLTLATAADEDPAIAASAAAKNWLAEIDAGQYEKSYSDGCAAFQHKVSEQEWTVVLKALRPSFGDLISRKEVSHTYKPDGYEGLDGQCMIIAYNSTFSKVPVEIEYVVLKREDGVWRGAGYNAQAQPQDAPGGPDAADVNSQTEVQETQVRAPKAP